MVHGNIHSTYDSSDLLYQPNGIIVPDEYFLYILVHAFSWIELIDEIRMQWDWTK